MSDKLILLVAVLVLAGCAVHSAMSPCGAFNDSEESCSFHNAMQTELTSQRYRGF